MSDTTDDRPTCFVVMPISTPPGLVQLYGSERHFEELLEYAFAPAIEDAGFRPIAPAAKGSEVIEARIVKHLKDADLVFCDISSLNANVFFELGMRTAMGRPVAVVRDTHQKRIPFDTGSLNHKEYNPSLRAPNLKPLRELITAHILDCVASEGDGNALLQWFGIRSAAANFEPADAEQALLKRMGLMLERFERSGLLEFLEKGGVMGGAPSGREVMQAMTESRDAQSLLGHQELLPRLATDSDGVTAFDSNRTPNTRSSALGEAGHSRASQPSVHSATSTGSAASQFGILISRNRRGAPFNQCSSIDAASHSESRALTIVSVHLQIDPISKSYTAPEGGLLELREALEQSLKDLAHRASIGLPGVESRLVVVSNELAMQGGLESLEYHVIFEFPA